MSLPKYLPLLLLVLAWVWLRLRSANERLRRIEVSTGAWRVQSSADSQPGSIGYMSDEAYARMLDDWKREMRDAA